MGNTFHCSICLPRLCLPLWKRRLGCHWAVLQERHLDKAHSGVSTERWQRHQNTNAGIAPEESRRARISLLLPGEEELTHALHNISNPPLSFTLVCRWSTAHPYVTFTLKSFPLISVPRLFLFQMPTNLPCSVALQPGPNDSGKVLLQLIFFKCLFIFFLCRMLNVCQVIH